MAFLTVIILGNLRSPFKQYLCPKSYLCTRMKNRLAMFLALVLLAQGMSPFTRELAKLPALVAHFYTHHDHVRHEHGSELTFFDFLSQHYGGRAHHDDAGQGHANLPFRCGDGSFTVLLLALPYEHPLPEVTGTPISLARTAFENRALYSGLFVQDVFRPPVG